MPSPADEPSIDVVIATHNRPELLRKALAAVLAQTYTGLVQCIVVFDRSEPDLSLELEQDTRRVRVVENTHTAGLAGARNTGILAGTGELVGFCDDDDEWLPDKLQLQVAELARTGAATCVTGIIVEYGDHSTPRVPTAERVSYAALARNRTMEAHPSSVLVRRDGLVGPIGLVDEEIPGSYGEDFDWILRAAAYGPIAVVTQPLVRVLWGQSLFSQKWQVIVDAIDYIMAKHPVLSQDNRARARLFGRRAFALAALGRRRPALATAVRTVRASPRERRAYLAAAVAVGVVSAERLMVIAHRRGHGI